jgi:polyphenol oxidase
LNGKLIRMGKPGNGFELRQAGELSYLQAPLLTADRLVKHAFSTRNGGCSTGKLASLNTAYHTEDDVDHVLENRRRFFSLFNTDSRKIVAAIQVHGTDLKVFDGRNRGEGALPGSAKSRCDALITAEPGIVLTAYAADCQLLYFRAIDKPLVALAHAGKTGSLGRIGPKVADYIVKNYSIKPECLLVGMSPAICRNCYMISDREAESFCLEGWGDPAYLEEESDGNGWKLDLTAINKAQLLASGISERNIADNDWCTSCHPDLFYSYRRDQGKTGRMIGFIAISKEDTGD